MNSPIERLRVLGRRRSPRRARRAASGRSRSAPRGRARARRPRARSRRTGRIRSLGRTRARRRSRFSSLQLRADLPISSIELALRAPRAASRPRRRACRRAARAATASPTASRGWRTSQTNSPSWATIATAPGWTTTCALRGRAVRVAEAVDPHRDDRPLVDSFASSRFAPSGPVLRLPRHRRRQRRPGGERRGEEQRVLVDRAAHRSRRQPARRVAVEVDRLDREVVAIAVASISSSSAACAEPPSGASRSSSGQPVTSVSGTGTRTGASSSSSTDAVWWLSPRWRGRGSPSSRAAARAGSAARAPARAWAASSAAIAAVAERVAEPRIPGPGADDRGVPAEPPRGGVDRADDADRLVLAAVGRPGGDVRREQPAVAQLGHVARERAGKRRARPLDVADPQPGAGACAAAQAAGARWPWRAITRTGIGGAGAASARPRRTSTGSTGCCSEL